MTTTTVTVPPPLDEVPAPDAVVAAGDGGPAELAGLLRAAGVATADVVDDVRRRGLPGEWDGVAADTAGVAFSGFAGRVDAATAALETAVRGLVVYDHQVIAAGRAWLRLDGDRVALNADIDDLRRSATEPGAAGPGAVVGLQDRADRLARRRTTLVGDFAALEVDVEDAEDRLVRVLACVDSEPEGDDAAGDPRRGLDLDRLVEHLGLGGDPAALGDWWRGLTRLQRELLLIHAPALVGGTDGLPTDARDRANRSLLERDLDYYHGLQDLGLDLTDDQQRRLEHAEDTAAALRDGAEYRPPDPDAGLDVNLLLYRPQAFDGDGAGAITYGDPDTADHTAVIVPGLGSDLGKIGDLGQDAQHLLDELGSDAASTSVVGWIGYDAPDFGGGAGGVLDGLGVGTEGRAEAGGHALVDLVDGLRGSHQGAPGDLTVIGHSYGSTTAAHAGVDGLDEDNLVLLGSPGAGGGVTGAADLGAPHLYVGAADQDPVTWLGGDARLGLGPDPSQADFGGVRIGVDDGQPFGWPGLKSVGFDENHGSYFDPDSESLGNLGGIVAGRGPISTVPGRDRPAGEYLDEWLDHQTPLGPIAGPVDRGIIGGIVDHLAPQAATGATLGSGGGGSW